MSKYLGGPFTADFHGGYVFSGEGAARMMFAEVRGWGHLSHGPDPEKTQDVHLRFLVDALNEKAASAPTTGRTGSPGRIVYCVSCKQGCESLGAGGLCSLCRTKATR